MFLFEQIIEDWFFVDIFISAVITLCLNKKLTYLSYKLYDLLYCAALLTKYFYEKILNVVLKKYKNLTSKNSIVYRIENKEFCKIYINNKKYILFLEQNYQNFMIMSYENGKAVNVTKKVEEFMGPNKNFFGLNITPKTMGFQNITFYSSDNIYQFKENDLITNVNLMQF